jgi:isopentenyl-diphosphate Delta-isomerase
MEEVVLVDEQDNEAGTMEKMEAHQKGLLHRAISVIVFNSQGKILLQQRAMHKYHSPGLWSNTCCSHPRPGETVINAAMRRLTEEMGISCNLEVKNRFIYKVELSENITEHELDYILTGYTDEKPVINKDEVLNYRYMSLADLSIDMQAHPGKYTFWFNEMIRQNLI